MTTFRYRARTVDQDTVFGDIQAESLSEAMTKLASLGFADVSLEKQEQDVVDVESSSAEVTFEFEGLKQDGSLVHGTLKSTDRLSAMRALIHQYKITPEYVCETEAAGSEKDYMRSGGVKDLVEQLNGEEKELFSREKALENILSEAEKDFHREIDMAVQEATDFLTRNQKRLSVADFEKLQKKIREVLRIKSMRDFGALARLKTSLADLMKLFQKKMGEIVDQDLKIFFSALDEYENVYKYAELLRKNPEMKKKLLFFELKRLRKKSDRKDAFKKIKLVLRGGEISHERDHHPAWYEIQRFLGALVFFYLILFGVAYYMTKKEMAYSLPFLESVARNELLYKISIVLFAFYVLLTLKLYFFRATKARNLLFLVVGVVIVGLVIGV
jgi:Pyruvate/2-oxoacid:ferredoxin oxidoreductase gamma subunit